MEYLLRARVKRVRQAQTRQSERRQHLFVRGAHIAAAGERFDEDPCDAVVHVAVVVPTAACASLHTGARRVIATVRPGAKELVVVLREARRVAQELSDRESTDTVRRRDTKVVGDPLTDFLVKPDDTFFNQLQQGDRRDRLRDAGDPKAILGVCDIRVELG